MIRVTDVAISHSSIVSLHLQLHNQLRQLILSGRWPHGARIPSETQLAAHLKLSRSTVRLALQQAEIEGLIERRAGRGTFVAHVSSAERKNRIIAFVTCDFDAENHLLILNGAESEVKARGYQVVYSRAKTPQEEAEVLLRLQTADTTGVLLWANAVHSHENHAEWFQQLHMPITLIDRKILGFSCDLVASDNYGGAAALMRHLIELGHREIVFLSHQEIWLSTVMERYRAYVETLREAALTPREPWLLSQPGKEPTMRDVLRSSVDSRSEELQTIKKYMTELKPAPTAIFAVNDYVAILAMRALKLLAIRVPGAVSVAGFDGSDLGAHLDIPLTTVGQDSFTIGKRGAQLLIDRIEHGAGDPLEVVIPTVFYSRASTAMLTAIPT